MIALWYEGRDDERSNVQLTDNGGRMSEIILMLEIPVDPDGSPSKSSEDSSTPDIEILIATRFDDL
jgi:hypothetical protein